MTVQAIPTRTLSLEQRREHVLAYASTPHGQKHDYLAEHKISPWQIKSWKAAVADGISTED